MSLQIASQERKPCFFEISLAGRLETSTYAQLEQKIASLMSTPVKAIVLDLAMMDYISSVGLRVILKTMRDLKARGALFMVANMQPSIKQIFKITHLLPDDSIFTNMEEADRYYTAIQEKIKPGKI